MELYCAQLLESLYSTQPQSFNSTLKSEAVVHSLLNFGARKSLGALLFAVALIASGCHRNNQISGFGIAWVTLTDDPGDFTSYIVTIDTVTMTGKTSGVVNAIAVPELVDLTKLRNISELWAAASLPNDTYTTATVTLDYSHAQISVMVNGVPQLAKLVDHTGAALTTLTLVINLDPGNPLTIQPTFASTDAPRLALNFDLVASNSVDLTTTPPTVTVKPFMTAATSASDSKLIRVRGPLINSSLGLGTYTVLIRPFFDEANSLGSLSIFNDANTVYSLNGLSYLGSPGLNALSQTSAGSTLTAAYTTFEPTTAPAAMVSAGIFHTKYVIAGGTLEDFFTDGLEGDVIARSGGTLTLRGATLFQNAIQSVNFAPLDSIVVLGPSTVVTADGVNTPGGLNFNAIAVGQHVTVRGLYSVDSTGVVHFDSSGTTATDTGSVRIQSSFVSGSVVSAAPGSVVLNVQTIDNWPISAFNFAGNGATGAQDSNPAAYAVATGSLAIPAGPSGAALGVGDLLAIDGFTSPFGSAPPDFVATDINAEPTVPATMLVHWTAGTTAPFATSSATGLTVNLGNAAFTSGTIRIGSESIDMTTLSATPQINPAAPTTMNGLPLFTPLFSVGDSTSVAGISSFNTLAGFEAQLVTSFASVSANKMVSRGFYNRGTNVFTASTIDVVL
jgi:hypothetical protein